MTPYSSASLKACSSACFDPEISQAEDPPISYLYTPDRKSYLFADPQMQKFSIDIPSIEIESNKIIFTITPQPAVYYKNELIYSHAEFLKRVKLPENINQDLQDKISMVARYLAQGEEFQYFLRQFKQLS